MNCSNFEQLIALYVEEDLSVVERGRVEAHLKECSTCWDLAEDLKESQSVFKSIRQEIPNASALSVLRERVLNEVSGLESMTWFERFVFGGLRKAALAGIAVVLVGSGALWLARSPRVTPAEPIAVAVDPIPPAVVAPERIPDEPQSSPAQRPRTKLTLQPAPVPELPTDERKQVAIKFLTDDPNVIIYWLVDEKGD